jgi:hypothetical protein
MRRSAGMRQGRLIVTGARCWFCACWRFGLGRALFAFWLSLVGTVLVTALLIATFRELISTRSLFRLPARLVDSANG